MPGILEIFQIQGSTEQSAQEAARFFGIKLINSVDFLELLFRFTFNLAVCLIIAAYIYRGTIKKREFSFTFILISSAIFLLCFLLQNVSLELGFALGLFAIFAILRYHTTTIPIKEMTYLFVLISLAVINALANKKVSYAELLFTNTIVIFLLWVLERRWFKNTEASRRVIYGNLELIKPENHSELLKDLHEKTGMNVTSVRVGTIDLISSTVEITVYFNIKNN